MRILVRLIGMSGRYRGRLLLAYLSTLGSVGFALLIPQIIGHTVDRLVLASGDGQLLALGDVERGTLLLIALALLGASLGRGLFDFTRTYTTDSLSQKVSYDIRHNLYNKIQHLSFAYHDKEHTGDLMSKATADVEAVRRFFMMGLVRPLEMGGRVIAIGVYTGLPGLATDPDNPGVCAPSGVSVLGGGWDDAQAVGREFRRSWGSR